MAYDQNNIFGKILRGELPARDARLAFGIGPAAFERGDPRRDIVVPFPGELPLRQPAGSRLDTS